jgi:hypothetical protein
MIAILFTIQKTEDEKIFYLEKEMACIEMYAYWFWVILGYVEICFSSTCEISHT